MKKLLTLISLVVIVTMSACETEDSLTDVKTLTIGDKYLDGYVIDNTEGIITLMKLQSEGLFTPNEVLNMDFGIWRLPTRVEALEIVRLANDVRTTQDSWWYYCLTSNNDLVIRTRYSMTEFTVKYPEIDGLYYLRLVRTVQ